MHHVIKHFNLEFVPRNLLCQASWLYAVRHPSRYKRDSFRHEQLGSHNLGKHLSLGLSKYFYKTGMGRVHADPTLDVVKPAEKDHWVTTPASPNQSYAQRCGQLGLQIWQDNILPVRLDPGPVGDLHCPIGLGVWTYSIVPPEPIRNQNCIATFFCQKVCPLFGGFLLSVF